MAELVVDLLEAVKIECDQTERLRVAFGTVEFLFEGCVEQAAILQARQRVRDGASLDIFEFIALDEQRKLQETRGREHVHHCCKQGDGVQRIRGESDTALKDLVPNLEGAVVGELEVSKAAKKTAKKLTARRNIKRLQGFHENIEKGSGRGRAWLDGRAGARRVRYGRSPLPVPAGVGKVDCMQLRPDLGSNRGTKVKAWPPRLTRNFRRFNGCKVLTKVPLCQEAEKRRGWEIR